jgi:peptidoglycan/LPS O-acetylase OafA/YrhL
MQYRPEIDGLRAFAIIPVVLYHAGVFGLSGGFAGVDVFFVISGYLITSIILSERQAGTFRLWRFYQRRISVRVPTHSWQFRSCLRLPSGPSTETSVQAPVPAEHQVVKKVRSPWLILRRISRP